MPDASAELQAIARSLRAAGRGAAMRYVAAEMRKAAEPLELYVIRAALEQLPHRGGLNEYVARQPVTIQVRSGGRQVGVRLVVKQPKPNAEAAASTDLGWVRHPVYGKWRKGVPTERIPRARGWWSETLRKHSDEVTPYIEQAMREAAAEIERGTLA